MKKLFFALFALVFFGTAHADQVNDLCAKTAKLFAEDATKPDPVRAERVLNIANKASSGSFMRTNIMVRANVPNVAFCDGTIILSEDLANSADDVIFFTAAHEIAHVDLSHDYDRVILLKKHLGRLPTLTEELGAGSDPYPSQVNAAIRKYELAADHYAARLAASHGYNLDVIAKSMHSLEGDEQHPSGKVRADLLISKK